MVENYQKEKEDNMKKFRECFLSWSIGITLFFIGFWIFSFSIFYEINSNYVYGSTLVFSIWSHMKLQTFLSKKEKYKKLINILVFILYGYWVNIFHKLINR